MKTIKLLPILFCALMAFSCSRSASDKSAEEMKQYIVDFDNPDGNIDLQLTDLAENFRIVPLETKEECLIGNGMYYANDDYILAYTQDGIYKFSPEGKFIKKIVTAGNGPQEISQRFIMGGFIVDEENDILYINDFQHQYELLVYDINGEQFLDPVKRYIQGYWTSLTIVDGIIMATPGNLMAQPDSTRYAVLFLTTNGDFISGIRATRKINSSFTQEGYNYQNATIIQGWKDNLIRYSNDDTIFAYRNKIFEPYIIFSNTKADKNKISEIPENGDRMVSIPNNTEPPGFIIINASIMGEQTPMTLEGGQTVIMIQSTQDYYFLDKKSGEVRRIVSYTDNITGENQDIDQIIEEESYFKLPSFLPNGKLYKVYNSFELMDLAENEFAESSMPDDLKDQIMEIAVNLEEEDNPVLLIGEMN